MCPLDYQHYCNAPISVSPASLVTTDGNLLLEQSRTKPKILSFFFSDHLINTFQFLMTWRNKPKNGPEKNPKWFYKTKTACHIIFVCHCQINWRTSVQNFRKGYWTILMKNNHSGSLSISKQPPAKGNTQWLTFFSWRTNRVLFKIYVKSFIKNKLFSRNREN